MTRLQIQSANLRLGGKAILADVAGDFRCGEMIALAGPNGAGKSSLLRLCAGLAQTSGGEVLLDGQPIAAMRPQLRARSIGYLPADSAVVWPMRADRVVALGRYPYLGALTRMNETDEAAIETAMDEAGVAHLAARPVNTLSSGERARVLIARAMAGQPRVYLMDEPTAALDPKYQLIIMSLLRAQADAGALVLVAAHTLDMMARFADRVVLLDEGRVVANGPPAESLSAEKVRAVFGVETGDGITANDWNLPV